MTHTAFAAARARGIKTIRLAIYQPKVAGFTEWICTLEDLEAFAALARSKATSVENAARDFGNVEQVEWERTYLNQNPNEVECAFCRAMPHCPSARRKLEETVGAEFPVIIENQGVPGVTKSELTFNDKVCARYGDDDKALSEMMKVTEFMEDWIKAVRAEVERRLLAGLPVPDFGLELGRQGPRKFKDLEEAEDMLRKQFRVPLELAYSMKLKSPKQIEELTVPQTGEDGIELKPVIGPRQWKKLADLITRSDPKPSVKPLAKIKTLYEPPKPEASDFPTVVEQDDLY